LSSVTLSERQSFAKRVFRRGRRFSASHIAAGSKVRHSPIRSPESGGREWSAARSCPAPSLTLPLSPAGGSGADANAASRATRWREVIVGRMRTRPTPSPAPARRRGSSTSSARP
jgi:hypothetical protein